jgi:thiol-disulfide isomerase/thioredoxin
MNKQRMMKVGLALALAAAAGLYLEHGPRSMRTAGISGAEEGEVLRLLRAPRALPDIGFTDSEGRPMRLSSFRGKAILLNIWATWCSPCRDEMPALNRLQSSLAGPDFEVVALSIDRGELSAIKAFYLQAGIGQLRIYRDQSGAAMTDLGVTAIPTTLLIDRYGNELGRTIGPAAWDRPALVQIIRDHLKLPLN